MCILASLDSNIHVIVITGGPCAGKTEGMVYLREKISALGYRVLVIPEAATKLIDGGIHPRDPRLGQPAFQRLIAVDIVHQEATFLTAARHFAALGEKVVVLVDRGGIEGVAYLNGDEALFAKIIREFGWRSGDLCEGRYHAAIHLVTAAHGAEAHYSLKNKARYETADEARATDNLLARSWLRHPHLRVIDNRTDFPAKLERLLLEVKAILGEPVSLETEDKYLARVDFAQLAALSARSRIRQNYLLPSGDGLQHRVRSRESADDYVLFYETKKGPLVNGSRIESERVVDTRRYEKLLQSADPATVTIIKDRFCFLYEGRFFELDRFIEPLDGTVFLEIERLLHERKDSVKLPPFVEVVADVSDDPRFTNYQIAKNRSLPDVE